MPSGPGITTSVNSQIETDEHLRFRVKELLVAKVPNPGKHHGDPGLVRGSDDFLVAH